MSPSRKWEPGGTCVSGTHLQVIIPERFLSHIVASKNGENDVSNEDTEARFSRIELDSHANIPVVGSEDYIIDRTGKQASVYPYSPEYDPLSVPIVDAAVLYECPFTGKNVILVIRNALHVPSMRHNLMPPFIMREAGIQVREITKIHTEDVTADDHAVVFRETGFRIPLSFLVSSLTSQLPSHLLRTWRDVRMCIS